MTDIDKKMIKNVCTGCASSIYNSIGDAISVVLTVNVTTPEEEGVTVSYIETVNINNGEEI